MFVIIRRSFHHLDKDTFLPLYKAMVRTHLDFCASVYSPLHQKDKDRIEQVQRRATRQLPGMQHLSYPERLRELQLLTLTYRRARSDMIELYKMTKGIYEKALCPTIKLWKEAATRPPSRAHDLAIFPTHCRTSLRKNSFINRSTSAWNKLPPSVVHAPSLDAFKRRLDSHWSTQDALYEYRSTISNNNAHATTTTNRLSTQ